MTNIFDYLKWRGDLTLKQAEFNEVDSLILCELSYINFEGIVSSKLSETITIEEAGRKFRQMDKSDERFITGFLIPNQIIDLLEAVSESVRFKDMLLCGYVNRVDLEQEKQFSAVTVRLDEQNIFVAYRGTDDTIVGWKEDFNMVFATPVPAQLEAVNYLKFVGENTQRDLLVGGHSKGGNLAVYASAYVEKSIQDRIINVYNFDGPGFNEDIILSEGFKDIWERVFTFVPQSSIIGMLLEHEEEYIVVNSKQIGIFQHDPFSWEVMGSRLVYTNEVDKYSKFVDRTLKDWISSMDEQQKELFIDTLYELLEATQSKTLTDLSNNTLHKMGIMFKNFKHIDESNKRAMLKTFQLLFKSIKENLMVSKDKQQQVIE